MNQPLSGVSLPNAEEDNANHAPQAPPVSVDTLDDATLLQKFEDASLSEWNHSIMLRVIYSYLKRDGRKAAVNKILDGMKKFISASPLAKKITYNVTVTYFWLQVRCMQKEILTR